MIRGLKDVEANLERLNIPFHLLRGLPHEVLPSFLNEIRAGMLIADFNPLRITMEWKELVKAQIEIPFIEVDSHNVLPCRYISDKQEYAAFTLRKKVEKNLREFLTDIPDLKEHPEYENSVRFERIDWGDVLSSLNVDIEVAEVNWLNPGEKAAFAAMNNFLQHRLNGYATARNFPDQKGQSELSPYLHFGHLSPQRLAFEVQRADANAESKMAFLEELIVRRELADNFCLHNPQYDRFSGFQPWAQTSLNKHRDDPREFVYTCDELEKSATHDPLWNAAQFEMVSTGKMHGFMRMYWAKKILEWTKSPEEAMEFAIYLNDKYELDGRDPNGYAGISWSIGGVHDRPWGDRSVFGMIRFMNFAGCKRKFDITSYINAHQL
jgi:deoxyribodipyrimidine photo-lyase